MSANQNPKSDPVDDLIDLARLGFEGQALPEAMLWEGLDLDDPDDRAFGDYELLERIGDGGMGVVFRARQISLNREVAIKFIVHKLADDARAVERFRREALSAARLYHPHIVPVYEAGSIEGLHFFSMPLLRGQTLAQRIARAPLSSAEAAALMLKLAQAVAYAHSLGLLHLDLKPANVLFDEHGKPMVGDFGLARHVDADGGVDAEGFSGTPAYAAPEQVDPDAGRLTPRTDVYALGAILYELLTGQVLHNNGKVATTGTALLIKRPRETNLAIPMDLDAICMKCLAIDPRERYASASELNIDFARYLSGDEISARVPSFSERLLRGLKRHPALTLAGLTALVAITLGLATTTWQWRRAEQARADAARQAERTQQLAGLMAAAFPTDASHSRSAQNAVAWLRLHAANDPAAQRDLLQSFHQALAATNKGDTVATLVNEIIDQLGEDYRERQVQRLAARGDRNSLLAAALIGIPRGRDGVSSTTHVAVLQKLFDGYANDQIALYIIALACHAQPLPCNHPEYQRQLEERFPDNAVNFILLPKGEKPSSDVLGKVVERAARANEFDDELATLMKLVRVAFTGEPVPDSIRLPMQAVVAERDVAPSLRTHEFSHIFLPFYGDIVRLCNPSNGNLSDDPTLREACGSLAIKAMHSSKASILAHMVAVAMVRRLYKGTPLDAEAKEYRRQYAWLDQHINRDPGDTDELEEEIIQFGEWEAWQRHAERVGIQRSPPPGWLPADPQILLLSEERTPAVPAR